MANVQQPVIPMVFQWISERPGTLSLAQGIAHYLPPSAVMRAVADAESFGPGLHRYGAAGGMPQLIERLSQKLTYENGVDLAGRKVFCTAGSNMGFLNAILAIADVGDEIILLAPYYFNHHMAIEMAGCRVVCVPTDADFQIDVEAIRSAMTTRTRAVVTISPNNPTGAVYRQEQLSAVNRLCGQEGCFHIHDEAYEYFVFGDTPHFSPASMEGTAAHTISLFSLSKAYGMAGWRMGYMLIPAELEFAVKKIQDTNLISPPAICQLAACAALDAGRSWCQEKIASIARVRERVFEQLSELKSGCTFHPSDGAFYILIGIETDRNDMQLVEALIRDFGVATLPGSTFGIQDRCMLRISFGGLPANEVSQGVSRLAEGLRHLL